MEKTRFSKLLNYLPAVIAFSAAVVAVIGAPKWNAQADGFSKITSQGWLVLAIGAMALCASILVTARNSTVQAKQKQLKEQIAAIGRSQLMRAMNHTIFPFRDSVIWREQCEKPESPMDLLNPERREILASLDLNADSSYRYGSSDVVKWHSLLESAATKGAQEITTALQIYAAYLPADVMEAMSKLLYSDFLQHRLLRIHDIIDANTRGNPDRAVPFFWAKQDGMHNADYEQFWRFMAAAMILCGTGRTQQGHPKFADV